MESDFKELMRDKRTRSGIIDKNEIAEDIVEFTQRSLMSASMEADESGQRAFDVIPEQSQQNTPKKDVVNINYNRRFEFGDSGNQAEGTKETPRRLIGTVRAFEIDLEQYLKQKGK